MRDLFLGDLSDVHHLLTRPETDKYNTLGSPETIQRTEYLMTEWIMAQTEEPRTLFVFALENRNNGHWMGLIGLQLRELKFRSAEVWFKILPENWGDGFATESLNRTLNFAFIELNLHRVEAGCATGNIASARVLEKAGMKREGCKRKILPIRGEWVDAYSYALLEEDFKNSKTEQWPAH
ncbi:MAG TPA: GNAT family protein [Puia sp.]|jgi:RimJ/RimL family protein N-acetyltransferase